MRQGPVPDLFLLFRKAFYEVKASGLHLCVNIFRKPSTWTFNENKLHKTLHHWFRDMISFDILEKNMGLVLPPHFVYDFSRNMFPVSFSINWPTFIVWLPLLLNILGNMCIAFVRFPGCDIIHFEINLTFLLTPKSQHKSIDILRTETGFDIKWKVFDYF